MKYRDLVVWQKSHALTLRVINTLKSLNRSYTGEIVTKQLLRAMTSVGANIAEGYGRHEGKEYVRFLQIAYGSSNEVDNWLLVAKDADLMPSGIALELLKDNEEILKILTVMIKKIKANG